MNPDRICPSCHATNSPMVKKCQRCQAPLGEPSARADASNGKISLTSGAAPPSPAPRAPPTPVRAVQAAAAPAAAVHRVSSTPTTTAAGSSPPATTASRQSSPPSPGSAANALVTLVPPEPHNNGSLSAVAAPTLRPTPREGAPRAANAPGAWGTLRRFRARIAIGSVAAAASVMLLAWFVYGGATVVEATIRRAVVQVNTDGGSGTGFFIKGPDEWAYVVTSFHVVNCGCPITVARARDAGQEKTYIEAYPEAEIAAYDADADLAIIRLRNVRGSSFDSLPLVPGAFNQGTIRSYGFPAHPDMRRRTFQWQGGNVVGPEKFPIIDDRTDKEIDKNVTQGFQISATIASGYEGGPTCDEHGAVVGVNAIKKRTLTERDGIVSVDVLRRLIGQVNPLAKRAPPTNEEVKRLLETIIVRYLRLPMQKRLGHREYEFLAITDMPWLRQFASQVRRTERDTETTKGPGSLSGTALLNLVLLAQTGLSLSTYRHDSVQQELRACEKRALDVTNLLQQLAGGTDPSEKDAALRKAVDACDRLAVRPLAWDITAMTLQWDPSEPAPGEYNVTNVVQIDKDEPEYRVSVTPKGTEAAFDVWVRWDGNDLKLKLTDNNQSAYGLRTTRAVVSENLNGSWTHSRARSPIEADPSISLQLDETMAISAGAGAGAGAGASTTVTIRYVVNAHVFVPPTKLACRRTQIDGTLEQSFTGELQPGGAIVRLSAEPKLTTAAFDACGLNFNAFYRTNIAMTLRSRGERLVAYRTDGSASPEKVEFERH